MKNKAALVMVTLAITSTVILFWNDGAEPNPSSDPEQYSRQSERKIGTRSAVERYFAVGDTEYPYLSNRELIKSFLEELVPVEFDQDVFWDSVTKLHEGDYKNLSKEERIFVVGKLVEKFPDHAKTVVSLSPVGEPTYSAFRVAVWQKREAFGGIDGLLVGLSGSERKSAVRFLFLGGRESPRNLDDVEGMNTIFDHMDDTYDKVDAVRDALVEVWDRKHTEEDRSILLDQITAMSKREDLGSAARAFLFEAKPLKSVGLLEGQKVISKHELEALAIGLVREDPDEGLRMVLEVEAENSIKDGIIDQLIEKWLDEAPLDAGNGAILRLDQRDLKRTAPIFIRHLESRGLHVQADEWKSFVID